MMCSKRIKVYSIIIPGLLLFSLAGCVSEQITPTPSITPTLELTPYWTITPGPEQDSGTPTPELISPTLSPSPTPTPITYTIVKGDTMLGVALKYGISLEELQNANPSVDPRILSLGTVLVIPLGDSIPQEIPTPTPLSVQLGQVKCYPTGDGGRWCTVLVRNTRNRSIENLSAHVVLFTLTGAVVAEGVADAPLNILREGETIALSIFFPGPFDQDLIPQASLLTALPVTREGDRYLKLTIEVEKVDIADQGQLATLHGLLSLAKKNMPASRIWLVGMAYDAEGEVIGLRKWEAANNLEPGKSMPFELTVFSIGPAIKKVEVLAEARP
jgi:LysM repeat protein